MGLLFLFLPNLNIESITEHQANDPAFDHTSSLPERAQVRVALHPEHPETECEHPSKEKTRFEGSGPWQVRKICRTSWLPLRTCFCQGMATSTEQLWVTPEQQPGAKTRIMIVIAQTNWYWWWWRWGHRWHTQCLWSHCCSCSTPLPFIRATEMDWAENPSILQVEYCSHQIVVSWAAQGKSTLLQAV